MSWIKMKCFLLLAAIRLGEGTANVVVVVVVVVEEKKLDLFFRGVHELMEQEGTNSQTWQR